MWRTSSYEGSTKAFVTGSPSLGRSLSQTGADKDDSADKTYLGLSGLKALESEWLGVGKAHDDTTATTDRAGRTDESVVADRIRLLRRLVELRGERVLQGTDVGRIVWLEGTAVQMTNEQELAVSVARRHAPSTGAPGCADYVLLSWLPASEEREHDYEPGFGDNLAANGLCQ